MSKTIYVLEKDKNKSFSYEQLQMVTEMACCGDCGYPEAGGIPFFFTTTRFNYFGILPRGMEEKREAIEKLTKDTLSKDDDREQTHMIAREYLVDEDLLVFVAPVHEDAFICTKNLTAVYTPMGVMVAQPTNLGLDQPGIDVFLLKKGRNILSRIGYSQMKTDIEVKKENLQHCHPNGAARYEIHPTRMDGDRITEGLFMSFWEVPRDYWVYADFIDPEDMSATFTEAFPANGFAKEEDTHPCKSAFRIETPVGLLAPLPYKDKEAGAVGLIVYLMKGPGIMQNLVKIEYTEKEVEMNAEMDSWAAAEVPEQRKNPFGFITPGIVSKFWVDKTNNHPYRVFHY